MFGNVKGLLTVALAAGALSLGAASSKAAGFRLSFGFGPVVFQPAPVVIASPVYAPVPVYSSQVYAPQPVYVQAPASAPVYMAAPAAPVCASVVVTTPTPVFVTPEIQATVIQVPVVVEDRDRGWWHRDWDRGHDRFDFGRHDRR